MVALPAATPVTTPLAFTVATAVLLLDQVPVPVPPNTTPLAEYVVVAPIHIALVPVTLVMAALGLIVML